jgi:hypothetical protein
MRNVPNGGWRSPIEAAILKGLGVQPGVPDLILVRDGRPFALELGPGGKAIWALPGTDPLANPQPKFDPRCVPKARALRIFPVQPRARFLKWKTPLAK